MPKKGGKRRKRRTHAQEDVPAGATPVGVGAEETLVPRSMIIKAPKVVLPHTLQLLQAELRKMMSPNTAEKVRFCVFASSDHRPHDHHHATTMLSHAL